MTIVEDLLRLELRQLMVHPDWDAAKASRTARVTIDYDHREHEIEVSLCDYQTPFGFRYWLQCPRCSLNRTYLVVHDGELTCRTCVGALYFEQSLPACVWKRELAIPVLRQLRKQKSMKGVPSRPCRAPERAASA